MNKYYNKYVKYKEKYQILKSKYQLTQPGEISSDFILTTDINRLFNLYDIEEDGKIYKKLKQIVLPSKQELKEICENMGLDFEVIYEYYTYNANAFFDEHLGFFINKEPLSVEKTKWRNTTIRNIFNFEDLNLNLLVLVYALLDYNTIVRFNQISKHKTIQNDNIIFNINHDNLQIVKEENLLRVLKDVYQLYSKDVLDVSKYSEGHQVINPHSHYDNYYAQKIVIPDGSNINIIGDIHGSLISLIYALNYNLVESFEAVNKKLKLKDNEYIIFTGDLVDYSQMGLEVLYLVFKLKLENPNQVFICDGNHEDKEQYKQRDIGKSRLREEIDYELGGVRSETSRYIDLILNMLPTVIFVNMNKSIFQFNHGSFPTYPRFKYLELDNFLSGDKDFHNLIYIEFRKRFDTLEKYKRFVDSKHFMVRFIKNEMSWNFKWGDFSFKKKTYMTLGKYVSRPNVNYKQTYDYLNKTGIKCILSGHQDTVPFSVLSDKQNYYEYNIQDNIKKINSVYRDKIYGYPLFESKYSILSFPSINQYDMGNKKKYTIVERFPDGKTKRFNIPGPNRGSYNYVFNVGIDKDNKAKYEELVARTGDKSEETFYKFLYDNMFYHTQDIGGQETEILSAAAGAGGSEDIGETRDETHV